MKIAIGCDHGALALKNKVVAHLQEKGYEVVDFGTHTNASCDYPEFAGAAAKAVTGSSRCTRDWPGDSRHWDERRWPSIRRYVQREYRSRIGCGACFRPRFFPGEQEWVTVFFS